MATYLLKNSEPVWVRALLPTDGKKFGTFLKSLSEETNKRFQPHPLTQEEAEKICAKLAPEKELRIVAQNKNEEIIAYFLLDSHFSENERSRYKHYGITLTDNDRRIAPVVADSFQDSGVGSIVMKYTLDLAYEMGIHYVILFGGTQATNTRAFHFYEKFGFDKMGEFEENNMINIDMMRKI